MHPPILYNFRRCPYAIRARLAIASSGVSVELREIVLRDKAPEFLETSPSGTVPCLKIDDQIIDESLDVMKWALAQNDPDQWLSIDDPASDALIAEADGPFKLALDRTKYASRHPEEDASAHRQTANEFLYKLDAQIGAKSYLFRETPSLADMAILPFVRQFAFVDKPRFDAENGENLRRWLEHFLASSAFTDVMDKYSKWHAGDQAIFFPNQD